MIEDGITLITPTGMRPEAFQLCEKWMSRQTYKGNVQWIVVDDGEIPTKTNLGQQVIRPQPFWQPGMNSQSRNLLSALDSISYSYVLIIEDDDWYAPEYIQQMAEELDHHEVVGEIKAVYYNLAHKSWHRHRNSEHASLCQTGFHISQLEKFKWACQSSGFIDIVFWKNVFGSNKGLFTRDAPLCVGIKELPGREGIGSGHKHGNRYAPDLDLIKLEELVGTDIEYFRPYIGIAS